MQVITGNSVHLPQNVGSFIGDNPAPHPCLAVQGGHPVIAGKLQIPSSLINGILQNDLAIIAGEQEVFSCVQIISFLSMHIPSRVSLSQCAGAISRIIFPLQYSFTRGVGYSFVKIILRLLTKEILSGDDPVISIVSS
ncbi:Uncharacterised protein [Shigella flexneri]|nr:Uncharacterised protein [Shigella flexneri]